MKKASTVALSIEEPAPGVWKIRLGRPEAITPVAVRRSLPAMERLGALAAPARPPFDFSGIALRVAASGAREGSWIELNWQGKSGLSVKKHKSPAASRYDFGGPWAEPRIMRGSKTEHS